MRTLKKLKAKGHVGRVEVVGLKSNGIWYAVRIGPFFDRAAAKRYQKRFDASEKTTTSIVPKAR